MVDPFDILYVFAEIQVGFLGFSALVSVMSKASWDIKEVSLRFWSILGLGFMGIVLSLLPPIVALVSDSTQVWMSGCFTGVLGWVLQIVIFTTRFSKLYRAGEMTLVGWSVNLLYQVPFFLSVLMFISGTFNLVTPLNAFFIGLFFFTLASVGNFIGFLVANSRAVNHKTDEKTSG